MRTPRLNSPRLWAWTVFLLSTFYCLWHGRIGLSSLDSSIVFDGAWRLVQGETIARDFFTPNGLVPMAIQALFFKALGVSWFSYCLHAALFNGLFALMVFHWLRRLLAPLPLATCYALLSGMVFYPPFGTPFMDQHAFFFVLLLLFIAHQAPQMSGAKQKLAYLSLVPIFALAFYSKQVPTLFALPVLPLVWWLGKASSKSFQNLVYVFAGLLLAGLLWVLTFHPWDLDWAHWKYFQWTLPSQTGLSRISAQSLFSFERLLTSFAYIPRTVFQPFNWALAGLAYLLPGLLVAWQFVQGGPNRFRGLGYLVLGWSLLFVTGWHVRVTLNQESNGLAFYFLALACVHLYLHAWWLDHSDSIPAWLLKFQVPFLLAWSITLGVSASAFHKTVVVDRTVHDFAPGKAPEPKCPSSLDGLGFMVYGTPGSAGEASPETLLTFLQSSTENFFFFGDQSFFYGMSGRRSPLPSVWFHAGLTYPKAGKELEEYDKWLWEKLKAANPKYLIGLSPNCAMAKGNAADFKQTWKWIQEREKGSFLKGGYDILELDTTVR